MTNREKILFRAFFKKNVIHPIKGCEGMSFTSLRMSLRLRPRDIPQEVKTHTFTPFDRMIVSIYPLEIEEGVGYIPPEAACMRVTISWAMF